MAATHDVFNQVTPLADVNLFAGNQALQDALKFNAPGLNTAPLAALGQLAGSAAMQNHARLANVHTPELRTHDRLGHRIDEVEFHPSYHALMAAATEAGLHGTPYAPDEQASGHAHVKRAAAFQLFTELEPSVLCPISMTYAVTPALRDNPAIFKDWAPRLAARAYDPALKPWRDKPGVTMGMGMTEKQGGSDVRANTTVATAMGAGGRGGEYLLRGHKWFFSAPQCDAHLVTARVGADGPFACFYVPRWRPDGSRNAVRVQRLKDKLGNRSNASAEVEFEDAWGILIGEEGRGIPTIIEMAGYTRLNCVVGSAAILRQATVQAIAYARRRQAFGKALADQPLMRAVLTDLALESEAALQLAMRLAQACEDETSSPGERAWRRIMTPAAKFWVCKRAVELTGEAMEVLGGNGYVEDGVLARLYREAPVNSIWEGSGNVMCLDVLRALQRDGDAAQALLAELQSAAAGEPRLAVALRELLALLALPPEQQQALGRLLAQRLVLLAQACLLRRHAPSAMADAFVATRLADGGAGRVAGAMDMRGLDVAAILARAFPA